jgi:hypothetical protein
MGVGDEDNADFIEFNASFRQPAQSAITRVNQIQRPIDDQQVRRLCLVRNWHGANARPERNEARPGLRRGTGFRLLGASRPGQDEGGEPARGATSREGSCPEGGIAQESPTRHSGLP